MDTLRTPDDRFRNLPGFPFTPKYVTLEEGLRMHYVEEGNTDDLPVLLLHGEPSWSYLYRKMIPILTGAGFRTIAPDLIGFGRSDKPVRMEDYTYARHLEWLTGFLDALQLEGLVLFCQDWGGLLGLRLVADRPSRFRAVIAANTFLPAGLRPMPEAFTQWKVFSQSVAEFPVGKVINGGTVSDLPEEVIAAYDAPFPEEAYKAGARIFPALVPEEAHEPEARANREAWEVLEAWEKPFLTLFGDSDPITRGAEKVFQKSVPGCRDQPHEIIEQAGHFLQEDQGERLAAKMVSWIKSW